jgi:phosphate-selective porin
MIRSVLLMLCFLSFVLNSYAQEKETVKTDSIKPKITMKGLFQARYSFSSHQDVDLNGLHHVDGKAIYNDFDIKRARLQFAAKISDRTDVVLLINLADFKSDPKNKVLENAYITYKMHPYLNFKMGQFRPAFGLEDMYPVDVIKSMDYSNQYAAFGNNGWQSFQIGASVFGALSGELPVKYEFTIVNGNNRNQVMDNDNGKHFSSRVELGVQKSLNIKLGINGGLALVAGNRAYASGIDLSTVIPLGKKWSLEIETEAKQGNNHTLFNGLDSAVRDGGLGNYQMRGMYFLPNLRYAINYHRLSSIEVSCRYEYFDRDFKHSGRQRETFTPMLSAEFLKAYNARIQVGVNIDRYPSNRPGSTQYNNSQFILQVQSRL